MGEQTFDDIDRAALVLERMVAGLEVGALSGEGATRLVERLVVTERVVAACRVRAATRAADANQWRRAGERSAASWVARLTGTTPGQAAAELDTARKLASLPATEIAHRAGALSDSQTRQITAAATADPSAETELLRRAATDDAAALKRRCDQVRAAADRDETAARERIRRGRRFRSWTDPDGAWCFAGRGLPEDGAAFHAAMRPHRQKASDDVRRHDRHEHPDAHAYDALITLAHTSSVVPPAADASAAGHATSSGSAPTTAAGDATSSGGAPTVTAGQLRPGPRAKLIVRVDHTALVRGHTLPGEVCEIVGTGPVTVATARHLARDAFLTAVVTDGVDIKTVAHLGRAATEHQRTALQTRGVRCAVPGCGTTHHLEIDHLGRVGHHPPHPHRPARLALQLPPPTEDPRQLPPPRPTRQPHLAPTRPHGRAVAPESRRCGWRRSRPIRRMQAWLRSPHHGQGGSARAAPRRGRRWWRSPRAARSSCG